MIRTTFPTPSWSSAKTNSKLPIRIKLSAPSLPTMAFDTRLRVGRAIGKDEEELATAIMSQIRDRCNPEEPPAIASDDNDSYPQAMLETWGKLLNYSGQGHPPSQKHPQNEWKCLQVTNHRSSGRLIGITYRVVYGDPKEVRNLMGLTTTYVERTNLTSRQMNGRMVRKTLSFS